MWALAVALTATMAAFMAFTLWQSRLLDVEGRQRCGICGGEREPVTPPPGRHRTYEVMACPQCADIVISVQGHVSRFAICPSCSQISLEVEAIVTGPSEVGWVPPVDVEEICAICGYHDGWAVPGGIDDLPNNVIEFPRR